MARPYNGTASGSPAYSSSSKWGSHCLADSGTVAITLDDSAIVSTKTGTLEAWIAPGAGGVRVAASGHADDYWLGMNSDGTVAAGVNVGLVTSSADIDDGLWHHVALVFTPSATYLMCDGARVATAAATTATGGATAAAIGKLTNGAAVANFPVDEVRWSTVARYTGPTYTVPAGAFVNDSDTLALFHLNGDANDDDGAVVGPTFGPDDANIVYSPGNWDVTSVRAKTINPGAYLRAAIGGDPDTITANFDTTGVTSLPKLKYRVDDGPWTEATVAATVALTIPTTNTWASHTVEIVVKANNYNANRWGSDAAAAKFTGFTVVGGTPATRPIERRALAGLVFGDSITEGLHTLSDSGNGVASVDSTQSYSYMLGDLLGAEIGVIGFGGTGVTAAYVDVPVLPTTYNKLFSFGTTPVRSFAGLDFIAFNVGTNDSSDAATWRAAFMPVVNAILAATSATVVLFRPFNGNHATDVEFVAEHCNAPERVRYIDTTGWFNTSDGTDSLHPTGYANQARIGPLAAAAIRDEIGEGGSPDGATWLKLPGGDLKLIALAT